MTSDAVSLARLAPGAVLWIEAWSAAGEAALAALLGGPPPPPNACVILGDWRAEGVEPGVWRLHGDADAAPSMCASLEAALGADGAVIDLTGAEGRLAVRGPRWREVLMFGGVFDAEAASFGPGSAAGTQLHHTPGRIVVIDDHGADVACAVSRLDDLAHHVSLAVDRVNAAAR